VDVSHESQYELERAAKMATRARGRFAESRTSSTAPIVLATVATSPTIRLKLTLSYTHECSRQTYRFKTGHECMKLYESWTPITYAVAIVGKCVLCHTE
jgi:hypothetical protein